ncbi:sulfotransferase 6B1 [Scophthalmus maximus]|uniref:sulfotransferase 6B1 n=1 Tax=Scophthalmus maximus TaxID=52904 RepID=UPI001FA8CD30|nr:sulfotransferase 6B1 [Scophthalmus maximus]
MNASPFLANMQSRMQLANQISDEEKLYRHNGVLYPRIMCPEDNLKALENFQAREDDVVLVAYPKCGFNWMVGVVRKIIAEATGKKTESKMPPLIEFFGPDALKLVDQTPSPRLLGTHLHPDNIPASFQGKKTKARSATGGTTSRPSRVERWTTPSPNTWRERGWERNSTTDCTVSRRQGSKERREKEDRPSPSVGHQTGSASPRLDRNSGRDIDL